MVTSVNASRIWITVHLVCCDMISTRSIAKISELLTRCAQRSLENPVPLAKLQSAVNRATDTIPLIVVRPVAISNILAFRSLVPEKMRRANHRTETFARYTTHSSVASDEKKSFGEGVSDESDCVHLHGS